MPRVIDNLKPFLAFVPEVKDARHKIVFQERIVWTLCVLVLFLICSRVPLYGMMSIGDSDPLYWMRLILASNRGSLTELGITPTVTSSMVMQMLIGSKLIDVSMDIPSDRALVNGVQKLLAMVIALGQALVSVWSGVYGPPQQMGHTVMFLLVSQLMIASMITTLLDDIISKGYGIGSGISLFIATNICEGIIWKCFSPTTLNTGRGIEFEGAIISLFHLMMTRQNKLGALKHAFFRRSLPNMSNVFSTIMILLTVVYLQGFRYDVKLKSLVNRGETASLPIRLFYTSSMPITLFSAFASNFFFLSQLLYRKWPSNFLVKMLGVWGGAGSSHYFEATGGFAYYISPPHSWSKAIGSPLHLIIYIAILLVSCGFLSRLWCETSGSSSKHILRHLKERNYVLAARQSMRNNNDLSDAIFIACVLGGMLIGLLSVVADLFGAIGSGTGILIAVTIIYQYIESISNAYAQHY